MRALCLVVTLLASVPSEDASLPRSSIKERDLEKLAENVVSFYEALEADLLIEQRKAMGELQVQLGKAAKSARMDDDPLKYLGDWELVLEKAKVEDRAISGKAGRGLTVLQFVDPWDQRPMTYLLSLPAAYGKRDAALLPAVLALKPPLGKSGSALEDEAKAMAEAAYGGLLDEAIVLVPLGPFEGDGRKGETREVEASWLTDEGLYTLFTSLRVLLENVRFDRSRLVLDGWGEAGLDAFRLASRAPFWFAGVVNRSGEPGSPDDVLFQNLRDLPLLYVHGEDDEREVDLSAVESVDGVSVERMDVGGSAVAPAEEARAKISEWILARRNELCPAEIDYRIDHVQYQSNHWVKAANVNRRPTAAPGDEDFPRIHARADRASNTIKIDTTNVVGGVYVFLSDALVDMDRPVKIELNGEQRVDRTFDRELQFMLENRFFNNSGDCGLYTNMILIEDLE